MTSRCEVIAAAGAGSGRRCAIQVHASRQRRARPPETLALRLAKFERSSVVPPWRRQFPPEASGPVHLGADVYRRGGGECR